MQIAVFADVHGNLPALEAVLADIDALAPRPDRIVCAGDLVGYGPFPNEVIDLIRARGIPTLAGNYDDGIGHERGDCGCAYTDDASREIGQRSLVWTEAVVSPDNKRWLRELPLSIPFSAGGTRVLVVHGSPRRINEYLYEDKPDATLRRILDGAEADVLVCGHTHLPYHRQFGRQHLINVGSVGKPKHGDPRAAYALVTVTGDDVECLFRYVPYDVERTVRAIDSSGLPPELGEKLRAGRG